MNPNRIHYQVPIRRSCSRLAFTTLTTATGMARTKQRSPGKRVGVLRKGVKKATRQQVAAAKRGGATKRLVALPNADGDLVPLHSGKLGSTRSLLAFCCKGRLSRGLFVRLSKLTIRILTVGLRKRFTVFRKLLKLLL